MNVLHMFVNLRYRRGVCFIRVSAADGADGAVALRQNCSSFSHTGIHFISNATDIYFSFFTLYV